MDLESTSNEQSAPQPSASGQPSVEEKEQSGTVLGYRRKFQITKDTTTSLASVGFITLLVLFCAGQWIPICSKLAMYLAIAIAPLLLEILGVLCNDKKGLQLFFYKSEVALLRVYILIPGYLPIG